MSSFQKLYADPLAVANQYAIVISGSISHVRKKDAQGATLQLMQVYAGKPVYAKLIPDTGRLRIEASGAAGTDTPRVYFLPWAQGSIYRVRPKASSAEGPDGNLFFTPNLDGCMVTVDGTPETPAIYHSNSAAVVFDDGAEESLKGLENEPEQQYTLEQHLKIDNMSRNVAAFQMVKRKNDPSTAKEPNVRDFDMFEYGAMGKHVVQHTEHGDLKLFEQECAYGAVFGVRKSGKWTFYKQRFRTIRREWDELAKSWVPFSKPAMVRHKELKVEVVDAKQFWP
jgi:hypothetical protein